ncbi:hypothetical protein IAU60_000955 [Kwoniella sp. DSM 27419]
MSNLVQPSVPPSSSTLNGNGSSAPTTSSQANDASSTVDVETTNGDAESSKAASSSAQDATYHAMSHASWNFNVGYLHQDWADVHLTFFNSGLKAHRLILARSPYLARLLRDVAPGSMIHLSFQDENITEESVHIALQHLYNPSQALVNPANARSVLSTSFLLGGMPELTHHSYTIIRSSLDSSNIANYVTWLSAPATSTGGRQANGPVFGSVQVADDRATVGGTAGDGWNDVEGRYGEWTVRLKQDVTNYLLRELPTQITSAGGTLTSDPKFLTAYLHLPHDLFKSLIESPELPIPSMQDRFAFAKKVIAQRKKVSATAQSAPGPQMEESVVLAFKGGDGMQVHVTRKPKKSRALWKVEG